MPCDILIVHTHRDYFGATPAGVCIGTNQLHEFLIQQGLHCGYFHGFSRAAKDWISGIMTSEGARSIGFYCDYENQDLVALLSRWITQTWQIPVIVGGPQAVGLDERFFRDSGVTAVVRGEGEYTLLELLRCLLYSQGNLADIAGITRMDAQGQLVRHPDRPLIKNLDELPWPNFQKESGSASWTFLPVATGRGCPFSCAFCYEGGNTRLVRTRSVDDVISQIRQECTVNSKIRYVYFTDDTFTLNVKRVRHFCREMQALRKDYDLLWFCEGHVHNLDRHPEMFEWMAESGMAKIFIGVESGSDETLKHYCKQTSRSMIKRVILSAMSAGISQITGNFILGGPFETWSTVEASKSLVMELLEEAPGFFDCFGFYLIPYPGTAITCHPEKFGLTVHHELESCALGDMPLTHSEAMDWDTLFSLQRTLNQSIVERMQALYASGSVPMERVRDAYRLALKYGAISRWYLNAYQRFPLRDQVHRWLALGQRQAWGDIPAGQQGDWVPVRGFELWSQVRESNGQRQIGGESVSDMEFHVLAASSGKLTVDQIVEHLHKTQNLSPERTFELLDQLDRRNWIAFSR